MRHPLGTCYDSAHPQLKRPQYTPGEPQCYLTRAHKRNVCDLCQNPGVEENPGPNNGRDIDLSTNFPRCFSHTRLSKPPPQSNVRIVQVRTDTEVNLWLQVTTDMTGAHHSHFGCPDSACGRPQGTAHQASAALPVFRHPTRAIRC